MRRLLPVLMTLFGVACFAQPQQSSVKDFIRVQSPVIALEHVRVIDGTGAAAKADQTIIISGGKITAIGNAGVVPVPAGCESDGHDRLFRTARTGGHARPSFLSRRRRALP